MEISTLVKHQQSFEPSATPDRFFAGNSFFIGRVVNRDHFDDGIVEMVGIQIYDGPTGMWVQDSDLIAPSEDFPSLTTNDKVVALERRSSTGAMRVVSLLKN